MKTMLRHIEFWSGITCLLLMAFIPLLLHLLGVSDAANLIITLILAAFAQVALLRFIYQRHRVVQHKTVDQVREMLRDRMLNRLAVLWLQVQRTQASESQLNRIRQTLAALEADISHLSGETLAAWLQDYNNVVDLEDTQMLRRMSVPTEISKSA